MPMVRAMRMLNAIEAGTTSGAQLESLLADPGRLGEMQALLAMRGQVKRMASSSTAMTAVAASATAVSAMNASSTAKTALYNSPIRTRILKAGNSWVTPFMAVSSGSGLFVKAVHANSFPGNNGLKIDGVYVPASKVSTYDVITRYTTSLGIDWYFDQSELVYIPC